MLTYAKLRNSIENYRNYASAQLLLRFDKC